MSGLKGEISNWIEDKEKNSSAKRFIIGKLVLANF